MKMNYIKFGKGDKIMLILPGLSLRPICDDPDPVIQAYDIFTKEFTVYLFDRRSDIEENYSLKDMAEDTIKKIEELALKDIYLFGVSQGGMISQYIAIHRPDLIKKLVLASTTYKSEKISLDENEMLKDAENNDVNDLVEYFASSIYSKDFYEKYHDVIVAQYANMNKEELKHFSIISQASSNFNFEEELKEVNIDTLVLGSKKDKVTNYLDMIRLSELLNGKIYLYDSYSHAVYDEAPDFKQHIYNHFLSI